MAVIPFFLLAAYLYCSQHLTGRNILYSWWYMIYDQVGLAVNVAALTVFCLMNVLLLLCKVNLKHLYDIITAISLLTWLTGSAGSNSITLL